jgi:hypothetical protein
MFGLLKLAFFTFLAIAVGIVIGTVPIGGKTIADRIVTAYESASKLANLPEALKAEPSRTAQSSRIAEPAKASPARARSPEIHAIAPAPSHETTWRAAPISAGAANRPDSFSQEDRDEVDQIIAARRARR